MAHALYRGFLHVIASPFVATAVFFLLRYWGMHNRKAGIFISGRRTHLITLSALLTLLLMTMREPIDAAFGWQVWWKGPTDQLSWIIGTGLWAWGSYRLLATREDLWDRL